LVSSYAFAGADFLAIAKSGAEVRVYLAGPLGFSEAGMAFHKEEIVSVFTALKYEILDPWQLTPSSTIAPILQMPYGEPKRAAWAALNPKIGATNAAAIGSCDLVFAVLDGTDVDSGTASEIGYAFALGKRILGYRGDFRLSADNEGSTVNLQVEYFIRESGGEILSQIAELPAALKRLVDGSERIPQAAAKPENNLRPQGTTAKSASEQTRSAKTSEQAGGAKLVIGILLALIVRAALEAIFKDPIQEDVPWPEMLAWFQLLIFSIMMARFYLGATRYIDTQPQSQPLWVSTANVIFASLIFCSFYVAALAVGEDEFYPALFTMHVVDAGWFLFGFFALLILRLTDQPGEIRVASNRQIMIIFFGLSLTTIVFAAILFTAVQFGKIEALTAKSLFLGGLGALSIFDFIKLREYYFRHANWIAKNTA
jgi:nucleoside 2-deoxyribosyltransferase